MSATWAWSGLNVLEERKRLEMAARGATARFEILRPLDFGFCRLSLAVPEGMAWKDLSSIAGCALPPPIRRCWQIS